MDMDWGGAPGGDARSSGPPRRNGYGSGVLESAPCVFVVRGAQQLGLGRGDPVDHEVPGGAPIRRPACSAGVGVCLGCAAPRSHPRKAHACSFECMAMVGSLLVMLALAGRCFSPWLAPVSGAISAAWRCTVAGMRPHSRRHVQLQWLSRTERSQRSQGSQQLRSAGRVGCSEQSQRSCCGGSKLHAAALPRLCLRCYAPGPPISCGGFRAIRWFKGLVRRGRFRRCRRDGLRDRGGSRLRGRGGHRRGGPRAAPGWPKLPARAAARAAPGRSARERPEIPGSKSAPCRRSRASRGRRGRPAREAPGSPG